MRALIQEACQGPVRDAIAQHGAALAELSESDLRPVALRDWQVAFCPPEDLLMQNMWLPHLHLPHSGLLHQQLQACGVAFAMNCLFFV